jgi:hypothetical protein
MRSQASARLLTGGHLIRFTIHPGQPGIAPGVGGSRTDSGIDLCDVPFGADPFVLHVFEQKQNLFC